MGVNVLVLLFTYSLVSTASAGNRKIIHVDVDKYHTCLPLLSRPPHIAAAPSQTITIFTENMVATRHHIIPYSTLSQFFNLVLEEDPLQSPLGRYLARRVREIYDFFEENDEAGAFLPGREPVMVGGYDTVGFAGRITTFNVDYRMMAAFAWLPGNLFYGPPPDRRANDPGNNIDERAERIVGSPAYARLRRIYDNMQNYIQNPRERTRENFDRILEDLDDLNAERNRPYDFDPIDWIAVGFNRNGKRLFDIKTPTVVIDEVTTTAYGKRKRSVNDNRRSAAQKFISAITDTPDAQDDSLDAALQLCKEVVKSLTATLNTNITWVNIDSNLDVLFTYSIKKKHFMYGQSRTSLRWLIREVRPSGLIDKLTDHGSWNNYYAVAFPFEVNQKQYFYAHNLESNYWFIQELKEDGKMGPETDNGHWANNYLAQFPLNINYRQYFYRQNMQNKNWFLQELIDGGKMGPEVSHGTWNRNYQIQFPFKVDNQQYFGGHNTESKLYFYRNIDENSIGSMGEPVVWENLDVSYHVMFPFSFGGMTYMFGHNPA